MDTNTVVLWVVFIFTAAGVACFGINQWNSGKRKSDDNALQEKLAEEVSKQFASLTEISTKAIDRSTELAQQAMGNMPGKPPMVDYGWVPAKEDNGQPVQRPPQQRSPQHQG